MQIATYNHRRLRSRASGECVFLSVRQEMTRFTRMTLGYSKDLRMRKLSVSLYFEHLQLRSTGEIYGKDEQGMDVVIRTERQPVFGTPNIDLVSTSYVERSNLTIRMENRRFTRLTNAFSKKLENHCHMLAVTFMHYNFCRNHTTVKSTPAVAAKVADHRWTLEEVIEMMDTYFEEKLNAQFEAAFAAKFTAPRTMPKTYTPVAPKLPWYLQGFADGENSKN